MGQVQSCWGILKTMAIQSEQIKVGQRVRVTQQIPRQSGALLTTIEGCVVGFGQEKTGSWFAHSKDHKLWLDRLEIRKDDGELVVCNLDRYSHIEALGDSGDGEGGGA